MNTSEKTYQGSQSTGAKTNWYNRKLFKYPLWVALVGLAGVGIRMQM